MLNIVDKSRTSYDILVLFNPHLNENRGPHVGIYLSREGIGQVRTCGWGQWKMREAAREEEKCGSNLNNVEKTST